MISKEAISDSWQEIVGAVKEKFGQITGDELSRVKGNMDQLIGLMQSKTGQSREQIESFLSTCCSSAGSTMNRLGNAASEYADYASDAVRENYDHAMDAAQRGYKQTVRTVSKRPLESLAVAVGAGLLAGLLVGLSISKRGR